MKDAFPASEFKGPTIDNLNKLYNFGILEHGKNELVCCQGDNITFVLDFGIKLNKDE